MADDKQHRKKSTKKGGEMTGSQTVGENPGPSQQQSVSSRDYLDPETKKRRETTKRKLEQAIATMLRKPRTQSVVTAVAAREQHQTASSATPLADTPKKQQLGSIATASSSTAKQHRPGSTATASSVAGNQQKRPGNSATESSVTAKQQQQTGNTETASSVAGKQQQPKITAAASLDTAKQRLGSTATASLVAGKQTQARSTATASSNTTKQQQLGSTATLSSDTAKQRLGSTATVSLAASKQQQQHPGSTATASSNTAKQQRLGSAATKSLVGSKSHQPTSKLNNNNQEILPQLQRPGSTAKASLVSSKQQQPGNTATTSSETAKQQRPGSTATASSDTAKNQQFGIGAAQSLAVGKQLKQQQQQPGSTGALDERKMKPSVIGGFIDEGLTQKKPKTVTKKEHSLYDSAVDINETISNRPVYQSKKIMGMGELPRIKFVVICILWLPRLFIPWINDLYKFNVALRLSDKSHQYVIDALEKDDFTIIGTTCALSVSCAVVADIVNMRYHVYSMLLLLYVLCPVAGLFMDKEFQARDVNSGTKLWLMQWAMTIPFIFTPVQFSCIFHQQEKMSREAHYNWTALFVLIEFINATVTFAVFPPDCPTKEEDLFVVWAALTAAIFIVIIITYTCFLFDKDIRRNLRFEKEITTPAVAGRKKDSVLAAKDIKKSQSWKTKWENLKIRQSWSTTINNVKKSGLWWKTIKLLSPILVFSPVIYLSFVFSTLQRFLPSRDWYNNTLEPASSLYVFGRILGVLMMAVALMFIWKNCDKTGKTGKFARLFSGDVMALGIPHLLIVLAFLVLVWRFEALSKLRHDRVNEGDVIYGEFYDQNSSLVILFNAMENSRMVCVSSERFKHYRVHSYGSISHVLPIKDSEIINFTVAPEPDADPTLGQTLAVQITANGTEMILISMINDPKKAYVVDTTLLDYYAKLHVVHPILKGGHPFFMVNNWLDRTRKAKFKADFPTSRTDTARVKYFYGVVLNGQDSFHEVPTEDSYVPLDPPYIHGSESLDIQLYLHERRYDPEFEGLKPGGVKIIRKGQTVYTTLPVIANTTTYRFIVNHWFRPLDPEIKYTAEELPTMFQISVFAQVAQTSYNRVVYPSKAGILEDWGVRTGLFFAGMSAGGVYVGVVYTFWTDKSVSKFPATLMSVFWALSAAASAVATDNLIQVDFSTNEVYRSVPLTLLLVHVALVVLYFIVRTWSE